MSGTASDVVGILSATIFRKTVSDSKMVTPKTGTETVSGRREPGGGREAGE